MGKKGSSKKTPNATFGPQTSVTMREASTGKKNANVKSSLKLQHLKNLAVWASGEASIPPLGAFFGHHLAASSEALGTPMDPSLFTCQRCESVLQPGYNCTIRIEKNKTKARHKGKKRVSYPQNNIVYTCHFCSHRNVMRGTPKGHMNDISPPKTKTHPKPTPTTPRPHHPSASSTKGKTGNLVAAGSLLKLAPSTKGKTGYPVTISDTTNTNIFERTTSTKGEMGITEINETCSTPSGLTKVYSAAPSPATPLARPTLTLLEANKRKRNKSGAKKAATSEGVSVSEAANAEKSGNRRRRKSWTSLKEIAESNENENDNSKRFMNLTVPFSMQ